MWNFNAPYFQLMGTQKISSNLKNIEVRSHELLGKLFWKWEFSPGCMYALLPVLLNDTTKDAFVLYFNAESSVVNSEIVFYCSQEHMDW